tara:strand:- start:16 stop:378 length:363 start_codon:yes stop_codon:yes gene_type:complete
MEDTDSIDRLRQMIDSIIPTRTDLAYPKEAVALGTIIRSIPEDRLGVVVDAYYGDVDKDKKKIIIYTVMLFADHKKTMYTGRLPDSILVLNEYEYDIIAYLMLPPLDLERLAKFIKEPLL